MSGRYFHVKTWLSLRLVFSPTCLISLAALPGLSLASAVGSLVDAFALAGSGTFLDPVGIRNIYCLERYLLLLLRADGLSHQRWDSTGIDRGILAHAGITCDNERT